MLNSLSVLFANHFPLFLYQVPLSIAKKRGAERTVHELGTDGANLSIRVSAPPPQSSRSSVPVCCSCCQEQSHCCVVTVTQTPHTTLFHFLLPFGSALRPQLSLTPSVVPFLFKVSSADSVKDKSKSEPEGHPLLFIIAQTQRPAACHKQP